MPFFGQTLPSLLAENKDLSHEIAEVHEVIGTVFIATVFYVPIAIHVGAAPLHHFAWKDNTIHRI